MVGNQTPNLWLCQRSKTLNDPASFLELVDPFLKYLTFLEIPIRVIIKQLQCDGTQQHNIQYFGESVLWKLVSSFVNVRPNNKNSQVIYVLIFSPSSVVQIIYRFISIAMAGCVMKFSSWPLHFFLEIFTSTQLFLSVENPTLVRIFSARARKKSLTKIWCYAQLSKRQWFCLIYWSLTPSRPTMIGTFPSWWKTSVSYFKGWRIGGRMAQF